MAGVTAPRAKSKSSFLPILIVLFVISYGLMCTLVVEQGSTIEAQRFLIRQLLGDSTELSAMKGRDFQRKQAETKAQPGAQAPNKAQAPQPEAHSPAQTAPARPDASKKNNAGKMRRPSRQKPPQDASEMADERRNLISI
jgi:hypothetical protein